MNHSAEEANSEHRKGHYYYLIITAEILAGCLAWCIGFYFLNFVANGIEFFESKIASYFLIALLFLGGTAVYFVGFYSWARAKGRSGTWALVGLIPFFGALVMGIIPKIAPASGPKAAASPLGWSLGIGLFVLLGFLSAISAIQFPMEIARIRAFCDRAAQSDLARLGDALKKLADERARSNCDSEIVPENIIEFMTGPHYGWQGTTRKLAGPYYGLKMTRTKPEILMRVEGDAVCACAGKGFRARDANTRYIYRISLRDGSPLPQKIGSCTGKSYGGTGATCYEESILGSDCKFRKPRGKPCE